MLAHQIGGIVTHDCFTKANSDTVVLYTREDFDYQRAAVHGVISCLKVL